MNTLIKVDGSNLPIKIKDVDKLFPLNNNQGIFVNACVAGADYFTAYSQAYSVVDLDEGMIWKRGLELGNKPEIKLHILLKNGGRDYLGVTRLNVMEVVSSIMYGSKRNGNDKLALSAAEKLYNMLVSEEIGINNNTNVVGRVVIEGKSLEFDIGGANIKKKSCISSDIDKLEVIEGA